MSTQSPHDEPQTPPTHTQVQAKVARGSALVVTNLTKLAGVYLAVSEQAGKGDAQTSVLATAALFVLGGQMAETVLLRAVDQFFGRG